MGCQVDSIIGGEHRVATTRSEGQYVSDSTVDDDVLPTTHEAPVRLGLIEIERLDMPRSVFLTELP